MPHATPESPAAACPKLPGALPLLGHLHLMRRDPLGTLVAAARLGDVARIDMGPRGMAYLVSHPAGIKRVLLDNHANFTKQTRGFDTLRVFLGRGLLTAEGDFWRRQRRIAQPAFHHQQIGRFAALMTRAAEDLADRWEERAHRGEPFDLSRDMMQVTLRIVGECLFSTDPSHESSTLGPQIEVLLQRFITRVMSPVALPLNWPLPGNRAVGRAIRGMRSVVDAMIVERRTRGSSEHGDLLDMLMAARDEETGEGMSAEQLRDEVLTLLVAGHETTAAALTWTWTLLAAHPEVDGRLQAELAAAGPGTTAQEGLESTPRLRQVIQESMRLWPPAWIIARCVAATDTIGGVSVPRGALVFVSPYATHRRPDVFPDPDRFDPDRFRIDPPAGPLSKYAYFPFGGGPRVCIGNGFAMLEAQRVLAVLRRRFRVRLAPGAVVEPLPLLTLRCKGPVLVTAQRVS